MLDETDNNFNNLFKIKINPLYPEYADYETISTNALNDIYKTYISIKKIT